MLDCHSPLFFRKIIEIERFALGAAISVCEEVRKILLLSIFLAPLPLELKSPTPAPSVHLKIKMAAAIRDFKMQRRDGDKNVA